VDVFRSQAHRRRAVAGVGAVALGLGSLYGIAWTQFPFLFDAQQLRGILAGFGVLAPLVYTTAHMIQVIFMAIPGYAMAVVGGYLFGAVWGTAYTMVGVTLGSVIAFLIARRYGRPVVERMLTEDAVDRFGTFTEEAGVPSLFIFVLVPVLPEDVISFVAGLAHFRLWVFAVVMFLGRLPAAAVAVLAGDGVAEGHLIEAAVWLLTLAASIAYTWYYREPIMERIG
jgi:uncharacterized membrane protein YdjX (TVP38/TMEM64 family)